MIKTGTLDNGFAFEINDSIVNDMEFIDVLAETEENPLKISKASELLLGKEQKKALYNHIRRNDGTVSVEDFMDCFAEIMEKAGEEVKN